MNRHELREATFKNIFQLPFHKEPIELIDFEGEYKDISEEDISYIDERVKGIISHLSDIDATIDRYSEGWKTTRMDKAVLAILRTAVYEIMYDEDIPDKVAVDEAVELAKVFTDDKGPGFVNGILSTVMNSK